MTLDSYKFSATKLSVLRWIAWPILLITSRNIVALIRPEPIVDRWTPYLILAWITTLLVSTWCFATGTINDAIEKFQNANQKTYSELSDLEPLQEKFLSILKNTSRIARNITLGTLIPGLLWVITWWDKPFENACSVDENEITQCNNVLGFGAMLLVVSAWSLALWFYSNQKINLYFRYIAPLLSKYDDFY